MKREKQAATQAAKELVRELAAWEEHRDELVRTAAGQWVLIREGQVVGAFPDEKKAFDHGYRQYGLVPFLVRRITEQDEPVEILSLWIAR